MRKVEYGVIGLMRNGTVKNDEEESNADQNIIKIKEDKQQLVHKEKGKCLRQGQDREPRMRQGNYIW